MMMQGYSLYECKKCGSLTQTSDETKESRCSTCRSRRLHLVDPDSDESFVCPICQQKTLQLNESGCWD